MPISALWYPNGEALCLSWIFFQATVDIFTLFYRLQISEVVDCPPPGASSSISTLQLRTDKVASAFQCLQDLRIPYFWHQLVLFCFVLLACFLFCFKYENFQQISTFFLKQWEGKLNEWSSGSKTIFFGDLGQKFNKYISNQNQSRTLPLFIHSFSFLLPLRHFSISFLSFPAPFLFPLFSVLPPLLASCLIVQVYFQSS